MQKLTRPVRVRRLARIHSRAKRRALFRELAATIVARNRARSRARARERKRQRAHQIARHLPGGQVQQLWLDRPLWMPRAKVTGHHSKIQASDQTKTPSDSRRKK